jgi:hypothetical protein
LELSSTGLGPQYLQEFALYGEAVKRAVMYSEDTYRLHITENYTGLAASGKLGKIPVVKKIDTREEWDDGINTKTTIVESWILQIGKEQVHFAIKHNYEHGKDDVRTFFIDGNLTSYEDAISIAASGAK